MHILVTNDDGPPSNASSPYIHSLIHTLEAAGHRVSVILPHVQRSWIGKAHMVGQTLTPRFLRPPTTLHSDDDLGTLADEPSPDGNDWVLVDGTPASCVQLGLWHFFCDKGDVDLVLSGPNYGRNTTSVFALSSGTLGGAMEGAVCGRRSIALSYAFTSREHKPHVIAGASRLAVRLVEFLYEEWGDGVELYSINVPVKEGVEDGRVVYTEMLENRWKSGSCFEEIWVEDENTGKEANDMGVEGQGGKKLDPDETEKKIREGTETPEEDGMSKENKKKGKVQFKWAPRFKDVYQSVEDAPPGNDGWAVKEGMTSVTPLRANFWHAPGFKGEIKLPMEVSTRPRTSKPQRTAKTATSSTPPPQSPAFYALIDYEDPYVQPLLLSAVHHQFPHLPYELISTLSEVPSPTAPLLQYRSYESIDFDHALAHPSTSLINAYVIRKALIRKHYLSHTVSTWIAKHPDSVLKAHFKPCVEFELDYAEFLDEALVEAWELHESWGRNEVKGEGKEWWILKPGMSDRGQGIRLFGSLRELQEIFEEWDPVEDDEDEADMEGQEEGRKDERRKTSDDDDDGDQGIITSQLRHFVAQPYIHPPLVLPSAGNRKFHLRVYVVAVGALKVYVYPEMLALFAAEEYMSPSTAAEEGSVNASESLGKHLTNTCLQDGTREGSVRRFWELRDDDVPQRPPLSTSSQSSVAFGGGVSWKQGIFEQVCEVVGEVFEAAARGMMVHFQPLPNAFELFGVDFLVDAERNVWLLELNAFPDLKQTGDELRDVVVGGLCWEIVRVAVEGFFGETAGVKSEMERQTVRLVRDIDLGRRA